MAALAVAMVAIPAMAQCAGSSSGGAGTTSGAYVGTGGVDMLGNGIFEAGDEAITFPVYEFKDTNFDMLIVGNDVARSWGSGIFNHAVAENNLEIKKAQDSGKGECCQAIDPTHCPCYPCSSKLNVEKIDIGDRTAQAVGNAVARNTVKIVTNQQ